MRTRVSINRNLLRDLLINVRGHRTYDELLYLIDLIVGASLRRAGFKKLLPGHLIFRDIIIKVYSRENSLFYISAMTDMLLHVMPYYEKKTYNVIRSILEPGDTFIDIGAHIGSYVIPMSRQVGPKGLVIAIEPNPFIFNILLKNLTLNKINNVIPINKAIFSKPARLKLHFNLKASGISSILSNWKEKVKQDVLFIPREFNMVEVEAITLDELLDKISKRRAMRYIKLIKIDVEGAEVEVIRGAIKTLSKTNYIVFESNKENLGEILQVLSHRFKVKLLEARGFTSNFIAIRKL